MSSDGRHTKLIARAARERLKPLGMVQRGRSRTWVGDNGWWLGIVEFQPSSWSSYLNVGAAWLWNPRRHLAFDTTNGSPSARVDVSGHGQYVEYQSDEQFGPLAELLAATAADEMQLLRHRLRTLSTAADHLRAVPERDLLGSLDAGVVYGLLGDARTASAMLGRFIDWYESNDAPGQPDANTIRYERALRLRLLLEDNEAFESQIHADVEEGRSLLGIATAFHFVR